MNYIVNARWIATFMLLAFVFYGGGLAFALQWANGLGTAQSPDMTLLVLGVGMMLVNSLMVAGIGYLLRPVLRQISHRVGTGYLWGRLAEAVLLAVGAFVFIFIAVFANDVNSIHGFLTIQNRTYHLAMLALAFGSIPMCWVLLKAHLVPGWIAVTGLIGYTVLFIGSLLGALSYELGIIINIPGMIFEIAFPVAIAWKGFNAVVPQACSPSSNPTYNPSPLPDNI